jgi:hypothetical protein
MFPEDGGNTFVQYIVNPYKTTLKLWTSPVKIIKEYDH